MPPSVTSALAQPSEPDGLNLPAFQARREVRERRDRGCWRSARRQARLGQRMRETGGQISASTVFGSALGRERLRSSSNAAASCAGSQIERDRIALPPVGRDLQNGRAGQAAVREQNVLAKALPRAGRDRLERNAGQKLANPSASRRRRQRHQRRQRLGHAQAEAARHVIGKTGRAHFRDRQAAGRQHQRRRGEAAVAGFDAEAIGARNIGDGVADPDIDAALRAFGQQHGDDRARRAVAEQLAERLLVIGDAVPLDQRDEVGLRVAAQRRTAEVRDCRTGSDPARNRDW